METDPSQARDPHLARAGLGLEIRGLGTEAPLRGERVVAPAALERPVGAAGLREADVDRHRPDGRQRVVQELALHEDGGGTLIEVEYHERRLLVPFVDAFVVGIDVAAGRIDLDLLVHGTTRLQEPHLHVPHPGVAERAFVLAPLCDVSPSLLVPGVGRVSALLAGLDVGGLEGMDR